MRIFLLAASLPLLGCGGAQLGTSRVDSSLAALVPADTIVLTGVRMADLRSTELYKKLAAGERLSELDDFARRTNFDPRKDVDQMLLAYDGKETLMLARGNFNPRPPEGASKSDYKGVTVFSQAEGAYALLDKSTAAAGPVAAVRKAIDRKQSGGAGPASLLDRARAAAAGGQIWFVSNGWGNLPGRAAAQGGNLSNFARILGSIESASGSVDVSAGVSALTESQCRTEEDAKTLAEAVRGMVGLARLTVPRDRPELQKVYDGFKIEQQQRTIRVTAAIPRDLVDALIASAAPPAGK